MSNTSESPQGRSAAIKPGDTIRSFDFLHTDITGPDACFYEGEVLRVANGVVTFKASRVVFEGEPVDPGELAAGCVFTTRIRSRYGCRVEQGTLAVVTPPPGGRGEGGDE